MSMPENRCCMIEFDEELKRIFLEELDYMDFSGLIDDSVPGSRLFESDEERAFDQLKERLKQFLILKKGYKFNGTGVWDRLPSLEDVKEFFQQ